MWNETNTISLSLANFVGCVVGFLNVLVIRLRILLLAAAKALDEQVSEKDFMLGRIYPSLSRIREVSVNIALAVAKVAFASGLTVLPKPPDLPGLIKSKMYDPTYQEYV